MSKGLGHIQQKLIRYFRYRPYAAINTDYLARWIYLDFDDCRSHRVAILRAAKRLAETGYPIGWKQAAQRDCRRCLCTGIDEDGRSIRKRT